MVKENFAIWLESESGVHQVIKVPNKISLIGWIRLVQALRAQRYDIVIDLHRTLRTFIFRFIWKSLMTNARVVKISKERIRLWGFFCFKRYWPKSFRPTPWILRFKKTLIQGMLSKADTINDDLVQQTLSAQLASSLQLQVHSKKTGFVIMPSSRWPGKQWPVEQYFQLIQETGIKPIILGQKTDRASQSLVKKLIDQNVDHESLLGTSIEVMTQKIKDAIAYIGSDTGLAHLSESLGTPVLVILGPTHEESGFPQRLPESKSFASSLWCRPCSKDGRACFRIRNRYLCLNDSDQNKVIRTGLSHAIKALMDKNLQGAKSH
jgi:heptosyltransferase-2